MFARLLKALFSRPPAAPAAITDPAGLLQQADAAVQAGRLDVAEHIAQRLMMAPGQEANARHILGVLAYQRSDMEKALSLVDASVALDPAAAHFHNTQGKILVSMGRFDDAAAAYEKAMTLAPHFGGYFLNYASARKFSAADLPLIEAVERRLPGIHAGSADRINFQFALGKALDDCALYDRAFVHFREANEARFRLQPFAMEPFADYVDALKRVFDADFIARHRAPANDDAVQPVFILGMPRSGSTLMESLICRDSGIVAGGELVAMEAVVDGVPGAILSTLPYPQCLQGSTDLPLRELEQEYRDHLPAAIAAARRFTDKYPYNFLNLGLIALLFPRAGIIHIRRHPLDVCLSCYFTAFAQAHEYTYDIGAVCRYYAQYEAMMAHWHRVLPGWIVDVDYEALAAAPDETVGAVRQRLELGAQAGGGGAAPAHAVRTASAWQVRQPVYRNSVHRWRNYENHIAPFVEALRDAGVDVDPVTAEQAGTP